MNSIIVRSATLCYSIRKCSCYRPMASHCFACKCTDCSFERTYCNMMHVEGEKFTKKAMTMHNACIWVSSTYFVDPQNCIRCGLVCLTCYKTGGNRTEELVNVCVAVQDMSFNNWLNVLVSCDTTGTVMTSSWPLPNTCGRDIRTVSYDMITLVNIYLST